MQLQKQPNKWSCLPTSFAIVLNCPVQEIFDYLGHDGSEIIWPENKDPFNRRAFHIQEMIDFAYFEKDFYVTPFEFYPQSEVEGSEVLYLTKFSGGYEKRIQKLNTKLYENFRKEKKSAMIYFF